MIKFEEHDNQLFRMLDKPVQLKEKNTNVLVQFITHGVIGEYVMEHWLDCGQENAPIFVDSVDGDGDVIVLVENGNKYGCPFPMFEIIGIFVVEGSKDWALYQMMQGEKVTKRHLINHIYWHYDARPHLKCISEYNCGTLQIMVLPEIWLTTAEPTGWQLYKEPKYKGGDWLEFIDAGGRKSQGKYLSNTDGNAIIVLDTASNMRCVVHTTKIIRKLSPSEVKVSITLDGTVIPENYESFFLKYDNTTYQYARIRYADLSPAYAALVRELTGTKGDES